MRRWGKLVLSVLAAGLGGCIPGVMVKSPALTGRVVDVSGHPIQNAKVSLAHDGETLDTLTTKADGTFSRREHAELFFWVIGADPFPTPWSATASAPGYSTQKVKYQPSFNWKPFGIGESVRTEVAPIELSSVESKP